MNIRIARGNWFRFYVYPNEEQAVYLRVGYLSISWYLNPDNWMWVLDREGKSLELGPLSFIWASVA